jgi:hypothetical protein
MKFGGVAAVLAATVLMFAARTAVAQKATQAIEDGCVKQDGDACAAYALDPFFAALAHTENGDAGAITRIVHFGDSLVADDSIANRGRTRLQTKFGDAGAGFVFVASPHPYYARQGVVHTATKHWIPHTLVFGHTKDGFYGLGGASFEAASKGAAATFSTIAKAKLGGAVSHFELYYLAQPKGGKLDLDVDGKTVETVDTNDGTAHAAYKRIDVDDGAHTLTMRIASGAVRAFGVVMERDAGVEWDNLGVISGTVKAMTFNQEDHFRDELGHRAPNLMILFFGANEAQWVVNKAALAQYQADFEKLLAELKAARPDSACLVMSTLAGATLDKDGKTIVDRPSVPGMVAAQRAAAVAQGCAFWDTYTWMGGKGSMAKWLANGLGSKDLMHPTYYGELKIADALVDALLARYAEYQSRGAVGKK